MALRVLSDRPMPTEVLVDEIDRAGVQLGERPDVAVAGVLDSDSEFYELSAGWIATAPLLEGLCWCLVLSAEDAAEDLLVMDRDATPLDWVAIDRPIRVELADGTGHELDVSSLDEGWLGPSGWLAGFADQPVAVTYRSGTITLAPLALRPVPLDAQVAAFRAAFDMVLHRPEDTDQLDVARRP